MKRLSFTLCAAALACGPVVSTSLVDDAEQACARAHSGEGEKYDLYDTTLADLYLAKAREEQGHAHYDDARELAQVSVERAKEAFRKAAEQRTGGPPLAPGPTAAVRPAAPTPAPAGPAPAAPSHEPAAPANGAPAAGEAAPAPAGEYEAPSDKPRGPAKSLPPGEAQPAPAPPPSREKAPIPVDEQTH